MTVTEQIFSKFVLALNFLYNLYRVSWKSLKVTDARSKDLIFTSSVTFLLLKERLKSYGFIPAKCDAVKSACHNVTETVGTFDSMRQTGFQLAL